MKTLIGTATALMILAACQTQQDSTESTTSETVATQTTETAGAYATETVTAPTATATIGKETEKPMSEYKDKVAELNTSKGKITIRFFPDVAPNHVKNFI